MNVKIPLSNQPFAFAIIIAISFTVSGILAMFMVRKKMF